jgi:ppGpp synthetase/RelA/SpoT-type nucleotidyltranferase
MMPLTPDDEARIDADLRRYDELLPEYRQNIHELTRRLTEAITADDRVHLHAIEPRVKTRESLENKLHEKAETDPLGRIEDTLGVRIITYFRDDAIWVEQIVRELLRVHEGTYADKAALLEDQEFGYRSIQFVATMPWAVDDEHLPSILRDMRKPPPLSPAIVEIQIRSILEHGWAEIEHDLVYKSGLPLPRPIRRRFALTAALIENADEQLEVIRDQLALDRPPTLPEAEADDEAGFVERMIASDRTSRALDDHIAVSLDLRQGKPANYLRDVERAVHVAMLDSREKLEKALTEQDGKLGLRMAIVCADVSQQLTRPDTVLDPDEPVVAFPGVGIYWTALALLHRQENTEWHFTAVGEGRLAEYRDVGRYLVEHPDESAISIRERYRAQAYPAGAAPESTHRLDLAP